MTLPVSLKKAEVCVNCGIARYDDKGRSQEDEKCFTKNHQHGWYVPSCVVASFLETARKELKEKLCDKLELLLCRTKTKKKEDVVCGNCQSIDAVFGGEKNE